MIKFDRKLTFIDFVLILICFYMAGMFLVQHTASNRKSVYIEILQHDNYKNIAKALISYKIQTGELPNPENWYDILLQENEFLSRNDFMRYDSNPNNGVALNDNLINDYNVSFDTVLIFSGYGKKNLVGNKDVLRKYVENKSYCWFITVNNEFFRYDKRYHAFVSLNGNKKITIDEVEF